MTAVFDMSYHAQHRTDYAFATADAASAIDAEWEVVDAPHDFISAKAVATP